MLRLAVVGVFLITILCVGSMYFASNSKVANCPDDHRSPRAAEEAFDSWIAEYKAVVPDASFEELRQATIQMYLHKHCKAVLERLSSYEQQEPISEELLRRAVRNVE